MEVINSKEIEKQLARLKKQDLIRFKNFIVNKLKYGIKLIFINDNMSRQDLTDMIDSIADDVFCNFLGKDMYQKLLCQQTQIEMLNNILKQLANGSKEDLQELINHYGILIVPHKRENRLRKIRQK